MQTLIQADQIMLRLKKSMAGNDEHSQLSGIVLSAKLNQLFADGYAQDDIYGLVIPLLMQGKVHIDMDDRSERLEVADQSHRFQRSQAVQVFEDYLSAYHPTPAAPKPRVVPRAIVA